MEIKLTDGVVEEILTSIGQGSLKELCERQGKQPPEFLINATNVYRTSGYIVKQEIKTINDSDKNTYMVSNDTYYLRSEYLDDCYECFFAKRKDIDGKRIPVTMYVRTYVE